MRLLIFIATLCFASATLGATFEVRKTYPDNETRWQPDARMLLYATVDGKEYLIAPEDKNWNFFYIEIVMTEDLDGDGLQEAVVSTSHSGNCCGPNYFVVSHRGNGFFSVHTHGNLHDVGYDLKLTTYFGIKMLEVSDTLPSLDTIDQELTHLLKFSAGTLESVRTLRNMALIPAIIEVTAADVQYENKTLNFDVDGDDIEDKITCNFWPRWKSVICGDIEASSKGKIILSHGCSRIGFLKSKTDGVHDIVCSRSDILQYSAQDKRYDFRTLSVEELLEEVNSAIDEYLSETNNDSGVVKNKFSIELGRKLSEQIAPCWELTDENNTTVTVSFYLDKAGRVLNNNIELISDQETYDTSKRMAFVNAKKAIFKCQQKLGGFNLTGFEYDKWRNIQMTFKPSK